MVNWTELALLSRTAVHLRPSQVSQRVRLRAQRVALRRFPQTARWLLAGPDPATAVGWPAHFRPNDSSLWRDWAGLAALRDGRIDLLGMTRQLTGLGGAESVGPAWSEADWEQVSAPTLWRFHLHYWDWAWALAATADRLHARTMFAAMWLSWQRGTPPGFGDAWLPYPAALRAWSWCGLHRSLVVDSDIEDDFLASLAKHTGFLRRHLESDVGGNHLIKNLKALAGLAIFFGDERLLDGTLDRLSRQLTLQVLPDGGHFERAPAYHCQVLADLLDLAHLLRSEGRNPPADLAMAIHQMRQWLACVLSPSGEVPLLNDGYPVDPVLIRLLEPGAPPPDPLLVLPYTGLVRATAGGWHMLADVGAPCPEELPAHAHADTLTCLVHVDGVPLLIDTGTSTYAPGVIRNYERSTAAHNTVEVDGANSTEVWGVFRAARRARVTSLATRADSTIVMAEATHDGFRRLPGRPRHSRRWSLSESGLRIEDLVSGDGVHSVAVRWHLAPGTELRLTARGATVATPTSKFQVTVTGQPMTTMVAESAPVATGFDRNIPAPVLTCRLRARLPVRITADWQRARVTQPTAADAATLTVGGAT